MAEHPNEIQAQAGISHRNIFGAASLASLGIAAGSLRTRKAKADDERKGEPKKEVEPLAPLKYDLETNFGITRDEIAKLPTKESGILRRA